MAYSDYAVLCPYFHRRDGKTISCDGPVLNTTVHWIWHSSEEAVQQQAIFCAKHYERCELYRCIRSNLCDDEE